jgi:molecular chaperone GrpE
VTDFEPAPLDAEGTPPPSGDGVTSDRASEGLPGGPPSEETPPAPHEEAEAPQLDEVGRLAAERDEYVDALRRLQADFENYKKRVARQQSELSERATERLVTSLLPVLDTADLALAHAGGEDVKQVWAALNDTLQREGLERIDPAGQPFDPNLHEAVAHEPGDGEQSVAAVLRAGFRWKGRVLRPAMVTVRG